MKRLLACVSALAVILSFNSVSAIAEDSPANIETALYDQLMQNETYDTNGDGVISEEEFLQINYLNIDLTDITSLDFLNTLPNLRFLYMRNGSFADFSFLKNSTSLSTLQLSNMPQVTDVSFIKEMNLDKCYLSQMDQITDDMRINLLRFRMQKMVLWDFLIWLVHCHRGFSYILICHLQLTTQILPALIEMVYNLCRHLLLRFMEKLRELLRTPFPSKMKLSIREQ